MSLLYLRYSVLCKRRQKLRHLAMSSRQMLISIRYTWVFKQATVLAIVWRTCINQRSQDQEMKLYLSVYFLLFPYFILRSTAFLLCQCIHSIKNECVCRKTVLITGCETLKWVPRLVFYVCKCCQSYRSGVFFSCLFVRLLLFFEQLFCIETSCIKQSCLVFRLLFAIGEVRTRAIIINNYNI